MGHKRQPLLVIREKKATVAPLVDAKCVGCEITVSPTLAARGSVLEGIMFTTRTGAEKLPDHSYIETSKRVGFWKRKKGYLCSECAGCFKVLTQRRQIGESDLYEEIHHPLVKVDPHFSFYNDSSTTDRARVRPKILNTRYTQ